MGPLYDVVIIGGGINGCGCAADAAMRGLSVLLVEKDDIASKTSSNSTKLIHGGLRYLEQYQFKLVKKALDERQKLLQSAPHLVRPQAIVMPFRPKMRPFWLMRCGLFLYDHLSRNNKLPHCESIKRNNTSYFNPLDNALERGFIFYDGITDDARLTLENALQAKKYGAEIRNYTQLIAAKAGEQYWELTLRSKDDDYSTVRAKTIINAAGPWVPELEQILNTPVRQKISLVKGSHIIIPRLYEGKHAYLLQHPDQRVIFVIPYHGFTLVGTTDIPVENANKIAISQEETDYLLDITNQYFKTKITFQDIIHTYSGVRALLADNDKKAQKLSREYSYAVTTKPLPAVTIYSGKITTYRVLAEEVINRLQPFFPPLIPSQTATIALPGAGIDNLTYPEYVTLAQNKYSWLPELLLNRYLNTYGTRIETILASCSDMPSLGKNFGAGLYQVEVDFLIKFEWAQTAEDILYRRTKLGFKMKESDKQKLTQYLKPSRFKAHHPVQIEPLLP